MIRQHEVWPPNLAEDGAATTSIQPNGGHNLLYDPHVMRQKGLAVAGFIAQLEDQNGRANRIGTIEDELGQLLAQTRLADIQTDTIAMLEQVADTIPYEGIGRNAIELGARRAELAARLEDINRREQKTSDAIIKVLHQVDDVLGFRDDLTWQLTNQRLDRCEWHFGRQRAEVEPELKQVTADEVVVAALYDVLSVAWPTQRIRRPEKELPIIQEKVTPEFTSPGPERRAAIGDRTVQFTISEESQGRPYYPAGKGVLQPSWESQPYAGGEFSAEAEGHDPCDEWFYRLNDASPPEVELKYDPRLDEWLHRLNGTRPPEIIEPEQRDAAVVPGVVTVEESHELDRIAPSGMAEEIVIENIKALVDRLRDPATSLEDLTPENEGKLTQHERIAAFLIARAGQALTGLDIGKFLYAKRGEELDAVFAVNKARTLMGPQTHGKKVLKALSPFGYGIQYGSKEVRGDGRARTMRLYRALSLSVTVLPETTDPAISWEPFIAD